MELRKDVHVGVMLPTPMHDELVALTAALNEAQPPDGKVISKGEVIRRALSFYLRSAYAKSKES